MPLRATARLPIESSADTADADGAGFVRRLFRVGVEHGVGEAIGGRVVHGKKDLAGGDRRRQKGLGAELAAGRFDEDPIVRTNAEPERIGRIDFRDEMFWEERGRTGDLAVRVSVCHWATLPRPVKSRNG